MVQFFCAQESGFSAGSHQCDKHHHKAVPILVSESVPVSLASTEQPCKRALRYHQSKQPQRVSRHLPYTFRTVGIMGSFIQRKGAKEGRSLLCSLQSGQLKRLPVLHSPQCCLKLGSFCALSATARFPKCHVQFRFVFLSLERTTSIFCGSLPFSLFQCTSCQYASGLFSAPVHY